MYTRGPMPARHPALYQDVGDEMVVYLTASQEAHGLNRTAALVYRLCDGRTPMSAVMAELGERGEDLLWLALDRLARSGLIKGHPQPPPTSRSRRKLLKALGQAALIPAVSSILVSRPASAISCFSENQATNPCPDPGDPPSGCLPCCTTGGAPVSYCSEACPGGCSCFCFQVRQCAGLDCTAGNCLGDTPVASGATTICTEDISVNCVPPGMCQRNCDAARTAAGLAGETAYACCEGCTAD